MGSADELDRGRQKIRQSSKDDIRIGIRLEVRIDFIRRHVNAAPRRIQEPPYCQQPILSATGQELQRRSSTKNRGKVRAAQPGNAFLL